MSGTTYNAADFLFPIEVEKSAAPTGRELMNRVGLGVKVSQPKPMGRPKLPNSLAAKPESNRLNVIHWHPDGDSLTNLLLQDKETIAAGSVLQIYFPDGSKQTIVLPLETKFIPFTDRE